MIICPVYLNSSIKFSRTADEHISHVRTVLAFLHIARVTLNLKKSNFFTGKIDCRRHVILPKKLKQANHTTSAICFLQPPRNVTELKSFFGLCNVHQQFVPSFAHKAARLNNKLEKGEPRTFNAHLRKDHDSLVTIEDMLVSTAVLALPRSKGRLTLDMDAYDKQVGWVLIEEQSDRTKKLLSFGEGCWTAQSRTTIKHTGPVWL